MTKQARIRIFLLSLAFTVLSACGGSGGSNAPSPLETRSSNWDELIWNQDDWG